MTGRPPASAGFTIIELMITVSVVAVLAAAALPSYKWLTATQRVKNGSTDLYLALILARSEAIKRNASVTITRAGAGWEGGWTITDASATTLESHGVINGVSIGTTPASIVYLGTGRISGGTAPSFTITSSAMASEKRCVKAALSGRPYIEKC
jgi:type IV fimbrial biogenesis protein FimT